MKMLRDSSRRSISAPMKDRALYRMNCERRASSVRLVQFVQAHQKEGLLPLGSMSVPY
ncbi:hypothetical protein [Bordetella holmesii]|uniref:Transposase, IS407 family n=2 Tax=Bordetella holmesii TaxID=35814 RepID=A0A158M303_9BORD|nr:hypothetical protein [Bordetella holmesii]KCV04109.1 hypothetical protein L498_1196 [Bordetella holmesii CDC-H629-BH]AMD50492.1 hypothetical protein F783_003020 [Bordetella holmesii F627]KAK81131.1 transposase, IS407 family [Bordetella holmesii CDC-H809-BH]KAK88073.1 transposase, IS407 family [Bordetella holmesii CDC-H572-BH]KAK88335.1 transposase, IS407 family [Bordetella holmesii CDC-H585-BH]